ncbi:MAG TPA: AAA-like domain-containing protein, partial [Chthonomonadaceae bacterium]|nr:AAA-like domain-containing protein [Chthonomonadaceae bacterium]
CLCLPLGRAQPREVIAEHLWPGEDWEATRGRLRQTLSWLRRHLEPPGTPEGSVLLADRAEMRLDPRFVVTDVADFDAALRSAAQTDDLSERIPYLRGAIALCCGELLPGYFEEPILRERERLAETHRGALGQLAGALAQTGDLPGAIEIARRRILADPLAEEAHGHLIELLASAGRTADMMRQYQELERILREELGVAPSAATRALIEQVRRPASQPAASARPKTLPPVSTPTVDNPPLIEPEGGAVPLNSRFYVERPTDAAFQTAIARQDSLVLVKGPRQAGKTSLLARGLQRAREEGAAVVQTDLQKLDQEQMQSVASLFETLAQMIASQLELDVDLEAAWNPRRVWNVNFDRFLRREVLDRLSVPMVWGLDEVDRLFGHDFSTVVFGLFRSWHNERSLDPTGPWSRLTLAIAYATEAHLFITDLNQSPFNVGTRLTLEDFTQAEVQDLNRRYGEPLRDAGELTRYYQMVGGHPYLVRRGLHSMAADGVDLNTLEAQAEREDGVFGDHLRRLLAALGQDSALCEAMRSILQGHPCPDPNSFYRLRSAGVLSGAIHTEARLRCGLYQSYLERRLL